MLATKYQNAIKVCNTVVLSYSRDFAQLVSDPRDDMNDGADGRISMKVETLESYLCEQNV